MAGELPPVLPAPPLPVVPVDPGGGDRSRDESADAAVVADLRALVGSDGIHFGKQSSDDKLPLRPSFSNAGFGQLQIKVVAQRLVDQSVELRIVELHPPFFQ